MEAGPGAAGRLQVRVAVLSRVVATLAGPRSKPGEAVLAEARQDWVDESRWRLPGTPLQKSGGGDRAVWG